MFVDRLIVVLYFIILFAFNCPQSYLVDLFPYRCPQYFGHIRIFIFCPFGHLMGLFAHIRVHIMLSIVSVGCCILLLGLYYLVALF